MLTLGNLVEGTYGKNSQKLGSSSSSFFFLKRFCFREEGWEGGEKHQCVVAPRVPPTGDLAGNPGMLQNGPMGGSRCGVPPSLWILCPPPGNWNYGS